MTSLQDTTSLPDYVQSIAKRIDSIRVAVSLPSYTPDQQHHFTQLLAPYVVLVERYVAEVSAIATGSSDRATMTHIATDIAAAFTTLAALLVALQGLTATPQSLSTAQTAQVRSILALLLSLTTTLAQELTQGIHADSAMHGESANP